MVVQDINNLQPCPSGRHRKDWALVDVVTARLGLDAIFFAGIRRAAIAASFDEDMSLWSS